MRNRILITDHDLTLRESLRKLLEGPGYEVLCAADADQTVATLATQPVDLLILDLDLPTQSGWDVLRLVTALRPLLPIIILTSLKDPPENAALRRVGALLQKPVDVPVLLGSVEGLLAEPPADRLRRATAHLQPGAKKTLI